MNELTKHRIDSSRKYSPFLLYGYECFYVFVTLVLNYGMWRQSQEHFIWQGVATALSITHICYLLQALHTFRRADLYVSLAIFFAQLCVIWKYGHLGSGWIIVPILAQALRLSWGASRDLAARQGMESNPSVSSQVQTAGGTQARHAPIQDQYRFPAQSPSRNFDDIHGMVEVKSRLKKAALEIVAPDQNPARPSKKRNGILLSGEPGNGKTVFVDALAGELGLQYITVTYGDVASKWINETTEHVVLAFREAAAQAPCILFIDEIDSLIPSRSAPAAGGFDETAKTTNSILTEIVNIRDKGVIVVGATNYLEKLDKAAIREGRFDYKIEVPTPDIHARLGILLESLMENLPHVDYDPDSLHSVALRWEGYSVKRIQAVGEELAVMDQERPLARIEGEQLLAALRRVQGRKGKIPPGTKDLTDLILPDKLRQKLMSVAVRMKEFERVEKLGGTVPAGLLFSGEPGTGKTETARSLAKESGWAFLYTSGNDLINNPSEIDRILAEAKDIRPSIVFIDEADDILVNRTMSHVTSVTNKLLAAMDGAAGKTKDIVYIAATNHPDMIDPAALRGGRFTEKLYFPLPDREGIEQFVQTWMRESNANFSADLTPGAIANAMGEGTSIANAAAIMQEAVNQMISRASGPLEPEVEMSDLDEAKAVILG